jgi:PTS system mannitol-specific IIC component
MVTGAGLIATPAPGSIFAYLAETPKGGYVPVLLSVIVAAGVSFAVGSLLLGFGRGEPVEDEEAEAAAAAPVPAARPASTTPATPVSHRTTSEA